MKKVWLCILITFLAASVFTGCSDDTQNATDASSVVVKDEVELVLEKAAWQLEGASSFLVFTDDKRVTEYDLSVLDGENQEVGKFLSYELVTDDQNNKTISISFLTEEDKTLFTFDPDTKSFITADQKRLQSVPMKTFVKQYMKRIEKAETDGGEKWISQAEMNVGSGVICCYWNALYEAVNTHLKTVLSQEEYETFMQDNRSFETARDTAMQDAGKEVEGGSMYPVVTNGAYSTETKKRVETIITQYFAE